MERAIAYHASPYSPDCGFSLIGSSSGSPIPLSDTQIHHHSSYSGSILKKFRRHACKTRKEKRVSTYLPTHSHLLELSPTHTQTPPFHSFSITCCMTHCVGAGAGHALRPAQQFNTMPSTVGSPLPAAYRGGSRIANLKQHKNRGKGTEGRSRPAQRPRLFPRYSRTRRRTTLNTQSCRIDQLYNAPRIQHTERDSSAAPTIKGSRCARWTAMSDTRPETPSHCRLKETTQSLGSYAIHELL